MNRRNWMIDELGVDEMGVDEAGCRRSGMTPCNSTINHIDENKKMAHG